MSVSIVQSTAGCSSGTQFSGEFQRLGRVGSKVSERPKKLFGCSCMNWHHFPLNDCIWRIPGSRNFNIKSRNSSLVLAIGQEVRDGFILLYSICTSVFSFLFFSPVLVAFISGSSPVWMLRGNRENECNFVLDYVLYCFGVKDMEA